MECRRKDLVRTRELCGVLRLTGSTQESVVSFVLMMVTFPRYCVFSSLGTTIVTLTVTDPPDARLLPEDGVNVQVPQSGAETMSQLSREPGSP